MKIILEIADADINKIGNEKGMEFVIKEFLSNAYWFIDAAEIKIVLDDK